jgi:para-aminobenzoate synthetase component II
VDGSRPPTPAGPGGALGGGGRGGGPCWYTGMVSRRVLVVDNFDSFVYNLVQYLGQLGVRCIVRRNDAVTVDELADLDVAGVLLSPGPGTPADAGVSVPMVRAAAEAGVPLFGVCLGHQAIGAAFGGVVDRGPEPVHGKASAIRHTGEGLFEGVPDPFEGGRYHSLVVEREPLPAEMEVTAWTEDGLVMGIRHREFPRFGVQFHPESILTPEGPRIVENFLTLTR